MPKYWGKQIFAHGRFPEVGQKQKTEKRERKRERPKVGNNNGQLRIATPPRVAHAKPPGPKRRRKKSMKTIAAWTKLPNFTKGRGEKKLNI